MEKIRNLSLKKTIVFYIVISLLISYIAGMVVMRGAERAQRAIWWKYWWKYEELDKYLEETAGEQGVFLTATLRPASGEMAPADVFASELCDFLQTYSILVFSVIGVIAAVALFYRNKIRIPLEEMTAASRMIAANDLDFCMNYENKDELGRLCAEFERMRAELEKNNKELWRMVESEKALRSAITHDIRTPLAVLQGYQEMLMEFIPMDSLDQDKIMEILGEGMGQIKRMNDFIETMRRLGSLKEREVRYEKTGVNMLKERIRISAEAVSGTLNKSVEFYAGTEAGFLADEDMILEVTENLLSNALRYAKTTVTVKLELSSRELTVTVADDGDGFTAPPEQVTRAFYHANPQDDLKHFGMGMYISRIYCEKHGGRLLIGSRKDGGALVKAIFRIESVDTEEGKSVS